MNLSIKKLTIIVLSMLVVAFGIYYFWVPANIAPGGSTGITVIIRAWFPSIPVSTAVTLINGILLVIGFIFIGKDFGAYTVIATMVLSIYIKIFEIFFPAKEPLVKDPFLCLIFGAICVGLGIGVVFNQNASTGGTDIIARILSDKFHIPMGTSVLIADTVITSIATITLGLETGLYSVLGIIVNSMVINKVISGFSTKIEMKIITRKIDEVNTFLNKEIGRGTTIYIAQGGFSYQERRVIYTVVNKAEYVKVKLFVSKLDPGAFITIANVTEVVGEGFTFEKLI